MLLETHQAGIFEEFVSDEHIEGKGVRSVFGIGKVYAQKLKNLEIYEVYYPFHICNTGIWLILGIR